MSKHGYIDKKGLKAHPHNVPEHVAIIMDGNGRWAVSRKLKRTLGHQKGVETVRDIVFACQDKGIKFLTLFAFGMENWKRPAKEVRTLFRIFFLLLRRDIAKLHNKNIQLHIIGEKSAYPPLLFQAVQDAQDLTKNNSGMVLNIAVNYSGRWDILQAVQKIVEQSTVQHPISESFFSAHLSLAAFPDPDLFIRTGGVQRISNFILWELAYTELYFTDTLWPDFTVNELETALLDYASRERRFGLTGEQLYSNQFELSYNRLSKKRNTVNEA